MTESNDTPLIDPHYARTEDYAADLAEIAEAGVCPFCPENFKWHPHGVIARAGEWFITPIRVNYPNAAEHYLIIGEKHKTELNQLSIFDLTHVHSLACKVGGDTSKGGALTLRFGNSSYTGATVRHLHFHLIVPELDPETGRAKTVNFPIG